MDPQSSVVLSHGLALGGQQSCIGSAADISVSSCTFSVNAAPLAAGSIATDSAIRIANMVRVSDIFAARRIFRQGLRQLPLPTTLTENTGRVDDAGCRKQPNGDQNKFHNQPPKEMAIYVSALSSRNGTETDLSAAIADEVIE